MANKTFAARIKPGGEKMTTAIVPTLVDVGSALAGGMTGAALGWHSIYLGLAAIYAGQYSETSLLSAFGTGMLVSLPVDLMTSAKQAPAPAKPETMKERLELGKTRALAFKDAFAKKVFLDRVFDPKGKEVGQALPVASTETVAGLAGDDGFAALDRIEQSLIASAMDQMAQNPDSAPNPEPFMLGEGEADTPTIEGLDLDMI